MLTLLLVLSLVTYRVTRFIILDSLIERWRARFYEALLSPLGEGQRDLVIDAHVEEPLQQLVWWRRKLYQLFSCPFCISVWVAAGATLIADQHGSVPLPVYVWLSASAGSLIAYTIIDAED